MFASTLDGPKSAPRPPQEGPEGKLPPVCEKRNAEKREERGGRGTREEGNEKREDRSEMREEKKEREDRRRRRREKRKKVIIGMSCIEFGSFGVVLRVFAGVLGGLGRLLRHLGGVLEGLVGCCRFRLLVAR